MSMRLGNFEEPVRRCGPPHADRSAWTADAAELDVAFNQKDVQAKICRAD